MTVRYFINARCTDQPGKSLLGHTDDRAYAYHLFDQFAAQAVYALVTLEEGDGNVIEQSEPQPLPHQEGER